MPNGITKLSYPAYGKGGIDPRLSQAHTHANKDQLDTITSNMLEKIANDALRDLSNLTDEGVDKLGDLIKNNGLAVIDVSNTDTEHYYVRQNGRWVQLSVAHPYPTISNGDQNTLTIQGSGTNTITIQLTNEYVKKIQSIDEKVNKLESVAADNVLVSDGNGNLKDGGVAIGKLIRADKLVQHVTSQMENAEKLAMSAQAGYELYSQIAALKRGIGRPRGTVANAFVSTKSGVRLNTVTTKNAGKGYKEGSLSYITTNSNKTIVAALGLIDETNAQGAVSSVTVLEGGVFTESTSDDLYLIPCESDTDTYAKLTGAFETTPYTTLHSIELAVDGDTAYVMQDETDNNSRAIYMYKVPQGSEGMGTWVKVTSFDTGDSRYILRYE